MLNLSKVIKPWKEADALSAHINLYGFWTESAFLTKSGDLGIVLSVTGVDYESLDNALSMGAKSLAARTASNQVDFLPAGGCQDFRRCYRRNILLNGQYIWVILFVCGDRVFVEIYCEHGTEAGLFQAEGQSARTAEEVYQQGS